jgi:hypothetical protein
MRSLPTWRLGLGPTRSFTWSLLQDEAGLSLPLEKFDEISQRTPMIANIRPSGEVPDGGFALRGRPPRVARTDS